MRQAPRPPFHRNRDRCYDSGGDAGPHGISSPEAQRDSGVSGGFSTMGSRASAGAASRPPIISGRSTEDRARRRDRSRAYTLPMAGLDTGSPSHFKSVAQPACSGTCDGSLSSPCGRWSRAFHCERCQGELVRVLFEEVPSRKTDVIARQARSANGPPRRRGGPLKPRGLVLVNGREHGHTLQGRGILDSKGLDAPRANHFPS